MEDELAAQKVIQDLATDKPQTNLEGIGHDPTQTCQLHVIQSQQSANVAGRDLRHVGAETEVRKNQTADGRPDGSRGKRDRKREKRISTFAGAMEHWAFFGELSTRALPGHSSELPE